MTEPNTLDEQIDYLLVSLYVGETFMQDNPNWRKQMDNPKLQATAAKLKALFTEHSKEVDRLARINELEEPLEFALRNYESTNNYNFKILANTIEMRIAQLKRNKGEQNE